MLHLLSKRHNRRSATVSQALKRVTTLLVVSAVTLASCVTTGPGGKKSFLLIGTGEEVAIGAQMNIQIQTESQMLADSVWQNYITDIGNRIVAVSDRRELEYQFAVIESDQINAFALPGGYIYFYTGLLKLMDNEAQLAAVMSHEISHVVARHGMKRMQTALIANYGYSFVFGNSGSSKLRDAAAGIGLSLVFAGYSRSAEAEADRYGIGYMRLAGYNPQGAVGMFGHLAEAGASSSNVFEKLTAGHPDTQSRISNAKKQIAAMGELKGDLKFNREVYQRMKSRLPVSDTTATK